MAVTLAPAALERVQGYLAGTPGSIGLRLGVRRYGCSGWGYVVDLARQRNDEDRVFEQHGVAVLVDPVALPLVDGTEIDFIRQGLNEQFVFRNPNAIAGCGCGESFTTQADLAGPDSSASA